MVPLNACKCKCKKGAFSDKPMQKRGFIDRRMTYTGQWEKSGCVHRSDQIPQLAMKVSYNAPMEKVYFRSQILECPSIGKY